MTRRRLHANITVMADDDLLVQARALQQRAEAVRAKASGLREELGDQFQQRGAELGVARDRAMKAKKAADHVVEDADGSVKALEGERTTYQKDLASTEARINAAVTKGSTGEAAELREEADGFRRMIGESDARIHTAKLDAAAAREGAGSADRGAMEAQLAYDEMYTAVGAAEKQIDKIEDQAALIDQARMKLVEADMLYGGDPPADADIDEWVTSKAALEEAADALLKRADAITVDVEVIAVVVPSADDPAPPNDDLMDPNDDSSLPLQDDTLGLDLLTTTDTAGAEADPSDSSVDAGTGDLPADEANSLEDVMATPTVGQDEFGAEGSDLDQTEQFSWNAADAETTDDWNSSADDVLSDDAGGSGVDDEPSGIDGF